MSVEETNSGSSPKVEILPPDRRPASQSQRNDENAYVGALAIVAHDLRGPLAALTLLMDEQIVDANWENNAHLSLRLKRANRIVESLTKTVSELLARARYYRDPLTLVPSQLELVDLLQEAAIALEPLALAKMTRIHCRCVEPLAMVGDGQLLLEAISNLLHNAIKFTRRGSSVVCEARSESNGNIRISVRDEGSGLTDSDRARLSRPFTKPSFSGSPAHELTGLGLWIARIVAERHGGQLTANNRPDRHGAEFNLVLPIGHIDQTITPYKRH